MAIHNTVLSASKSRVLSLWQLPLGYAGWKEWKENQGKLRRSDRDLKTTWSTRYKKKRSKRKIDNVCYNSNPQGTE
jgi:hypothetical protein